jgi:hypothetical protein
MRRMLMQLSDRMPSVVSIINRRYLRGDMRYGQDSQLVDSLDTRDCGPGRVSRGSPWTTLTRLPGSRSSCARIVLVPLDVLCLVFPFLALIRVRTVDGQLNPPRCRQSRRKCQSWSEKCREIPKFRNIERERRKIEKKKIFVFVNPKPVRRSKKSVFYGFTGWKSWNTRAQQPTITSTMSRTRCQVSTTRGVRHRLSLSLFLSPLNLTCWETCKLLYR